jgi:hypothetical protein
MVKWVAGLVAAIFAALFALPSNATAAPVAPPASSYTYDVPAHEATTTGATAQRGPPAAYNPATAYDAVDRWSHGASACQNGPTHSRAFAYDHAALHVQVARASGTTRTGAAGNVGDLSSFERSEAAAETAPSFVASADGVVVPTSRARLLKGFEGAGFPKTPTTSPGTQYTLPDGSLVRVMEPSGQAPLRASFANANGGPISPFTGKPIQPPPGLTPAQRLEYIRMRTHLALGQ